MHDAGEKAVQGTISFMQPKLQEGFFQKLDVVPVRPARRPGWVNGWTLRLGSRARAQFRRVRRRWTVMMQR